MIPAYALAEELLPRGHRVALITDERGARIPGLFDDAQDACPARRAACRRAGRLAEGGAQRSLTGRAMALRLYETFQPSAVIGFGGYPALPGPARGAARPHPDRDPRAECGARPGQPADGGQGRRDRHRLSRGRAAAGQGSATRCIWSAIRCATRCWRCATSLIPPLTEDGIFRAAGDRRQPGRDDPVRGRARRAGAAARAFPPPPAGDPAMPRRGYRRGARALCRARHPRRSRHLFRRICRSGWPGRIWSSPAPAPRPSPS